MSITQGFEALRRGQLDQALAFFEREPQADPRANIGRAQALLSQGKHPQAMPYIQRLQQQNNPSADLLLAQALGSQGKRDQAVKRLVACLPLLPDQAPVIQALLAEQKMRQGYWDASAALFIEALSSDDPRPLTHLTHIMHDIMRALMAQRIREVEVSEFLSTLRAALPPQKLPPQLTQMFQSSIKQSAPLRGAQPVMPLVKLSAPQQQTSPPPSPSSNRRIQHPPLSASAQTSRAAQTARAPEPRRPEPELRPPAPSPRQPTSFGRSAFSDSMYEQRQLNLMIQGELDPLPESAWPSNLRRNLDTITLATPAHLTVSERARDQQENDEFILTQGNIFAQIHLEECLNTLTQSIPYEVAHAFSFQPRTLNRIEINLLDDWLQDLPQTPDDPLDEIEPDDHISLALGAFIGETLARSYNAVWRFGAQPRESTLQVGKHTVDPMRTAIAWMDSQTKEDVRLDLPAIEARALLPASHTLPPQIDYIDPTFGLSGAPLMTRLAELWSFYFFRLARVPHAEIIPDMQELWQNQNMIVLRVHERWCPRMTPDMRSRGRTKRDGLAVAYKRSSGEFFMMCSRAQFSQALPSVCDRLDQETSRLVLRMLSQYHAPGATVVSDEHMATQWSNKLSTHIFPPTLQSQGDATQLLFWLVQDDSPACWAIQHQAGVWSFLPVRA